MAGQLLAADDMGERRADEADADKGDLLEQGFGQMASAFQEFGERGDDAAIGLFGADRHAQRVGKAVAGDAPQDVALRGEIRVGRGGRVPARSRGNG